MDNMSIPTMKHDNLNGYERILTADHESRERSAPSVTTQQLTYSWGDLTSYFN